MPIQDRITQIAFAKQSALGAAAASGTYQIGVTSGAVADLEMNEDELAVSWSSRLIEGHDRGAVTPKVGFETVAMPKSVGLFLAVGMGSEAASGSGPYTHVFKVGNALPYITVFARRDAEYFKVSDIRVDEVELAWEGTKAVTLKVSAMGCTYEFLGTSAYTGGTDERPESGVLKGAGGTFTVDGASAIIKGGSIKITNGVTAVHGSSSPTPADVFPAKQNIDVSLTVVPTDLSMFRKVVTGSTSGSSVQAVPQYGTVQCGFKVDSSNTLDFIGRRVKFLTQFPDVKADGGPVEVSLEGSVANDLTVAPCEFVLVNQVSTAY